MDVRTDLERTTEKLLDDLDWAEGECSVCGPRRRQILQGLLDLARQQKN